MVSAASNVCPECGAALPTAGSCREHIQALYLLESQVPGAFDGWPHFYALAAYGLQHPDDFCLTAGALADVRACVVDALAGRGTLDDIRRRMVPGAAHTGGSRRRSRKAAGQRRVVKWPLTIVDVCTGGVEGFAERAERWARSVVETLDAAETGAIAAADKSPENESSEDPLRAPGVTIRDSAEPVSSEQLDRIERSLKLRLPAEYRSFLLRANGGIPEPRHFHYIAIDEDEGTRRRQKGKVVRFYSTTPAEARGGQVNSFVTLYQNWSQFDFPWLMPIAQVEDALEGGHAVHCRQRRERGPDLLLARTGNRRGDAPSGRRLLQLVLGPARTIEKPDSLSNDSWP